DIDGKSAVVVPISSTKAYGRLASFHEYISPDLIEETAFYEKRDRWAKAEHSCFVSLKRLHYIFDGGRKLSQKLPNDTITAIQKKVLIAVSGKRILDELDNLKAQQALNNDK
ncbi:MAG: type II toxin-antitoxin system PemK/MazF family toxin, partial [Capnocytophaga sp.]|nr:type II toxin-antitoxin system PemK/MazF family toxin [Capnocytophaga sp.]